MTDEKRLVMKLLNDAERRDIQPCWALWCIERRVDVDSDANNIKDFLSWMEGKRAAYRKDKGLSPDEFIDTLRKGFERWLASDVIRSLRGHGGHGETAE